MTLFRALITRTVVVGVVTLMGATLAHERWVAPLEAHHVESAGELAKLNDRIEGARQEMWKIQQREPNTTGFRKTLSSQRENLPSNAPFVWLPPRMKAALSRLGVSEAKVQLYETSAEPALPGFERTLWHVAIPQQPGLRKMTDALLAVAQIEQQDHFINIQELAFHAESEDPGRITGFVNLTTVLPESKN